MSEYCEGWGEQESSNTAPGQRAVAMLTSIYVMLRFVPLKDGSGKSSNEFKHPDNRKRNTCTRRGIEGRFVLSGNPENPTSGVQVSDVIRFAV